MLGKNFGELLVVKKLDNKNYGSQTKQYWLARCSCGKNKRIRGDHLRSGKIVSCGHIRNYMSAQRTAKNSRTHGESKSLEYRSWVSMKHRCYNANHKDYKYWGARGIIVCDRWRYSFENFLEDMGRKPTQDYTIERVNNNGNYEPSNCIWLHKSQQVFNRRKNGTA